MLYDFTYMWDQKYKHTKQNSSRPIDTENKWVVARGGRGWGSEIGKQEQEVQTSSYKRISH